MGSTTTIHDLPALRAQVAAWRGAGHRIALVPTMGALHAGHLSLVELAHQHASRVVASVYVNPAQFGPGEDLAAYPRDEAGDVRLLEGAGCHAAYIPESLYTDEHATRVEVGGFAGDLEGEHRPGHFEGVALVLAKLFNRVAPDVAVFGEKDFQQLALVRKLVADLDFPIEVVGAPIARDRHGLALSSRNRYLDAEQLAVARQLNRRLREVVRRAEIGEDVQAIIAGAEAALLADGFTHVDYIALRDAATLGSAAPGRPARLLAVARIGAVRLLDNFAVRLPAPPTSPVS